MIAYRSLLSLAFSQRLYWLNIPQRNNHLCLRRPFLTSHRFWQRGFTVSPRSTIYRIYICGLMHRCNQPVNKTTQPNKQNNTEIVPRLYTKTNDVTSPISWFPVSSIRKCLNAKNYYFLSFLFFLK